MEEFKFAGVLTGDLVDSRLRGPEEQNRAILALEDAARDLASTYYQSVHFARYRGDGWQVFIAEGELALPTALRMVAALLKSRAGLTTRIGIGLGMAKVPRDGNLAAAQGEAFTVAGDVLAGLGYNERIGMPRIDAPAGQAFHAMTMLLDFETRNWTATQAEALFEALRIYQPTQETIAETLGITRQAVQSRLAGTSFPAIREALAVYESQIRKMWEDSE